MRNIYTSLVAILIYSFSYAQLPKWVITPNYDKLAVKVNDCLLQSDSLGISALWTFDGKCLLKTDHTIHAFKDGVAVITKKGKDDIVGVVDVFGKFTAFPKMKVAFDHPYFENGYLICYDAKGYSYYKKDGSKADLKSSIRSYPFHGGYAPYFTYGQLEKRKEPYYGYYRAGDVIMIYKMIEKGVEKEFDPKTISFLSGIGANNRGVAVIKNKLYTFNPDSLVFEPFLYGDEDLDKNRQLKISGDYDKYFIDLPGDSIQIVAKYGRNQRAVLEFDKELRPIKYTMDGVEQTFMSPIPQKLQYVSEIKAYEEDSKFGISTVDKQILPPQFEEVGLLFGNKGFVKHEGKWGLIEIIPDVDYTLRLNKGLDVGFRHQTFETKVRLDLPSGISSKDARIDIPASSGCVVDKTSRESKDTENGNFVVYNCSLNIPESLPDTIINIIYSPVSVSYDGISLFERPININAWHLKSYNVDHIDSDTSVSNGVVAFTINVDVQKNVDENDYPFEVNIESDSISVEYEKISESRYKCYVSNLQEGVNNLNIIVTEKGCPPSKFPFEVLYTKPILKKKTKESVVIRKKIV